MHQEQPLRSSKKQKAKTEKKNTTANKQTNEQPSALSRTHHTTS
jgi:hypothetical protein